MSNRVVAPTLPDQDLRELFTTQIQGVKRTTAPGLQDYLVEKRLSREWSSVR